MMVGHIEVSLSTFLNNIANFRFGIGGIALLYPLKNRQNTLNPKSTFQNQKSSRRGDESESGQR
jgi:hypothetical protein